MNLEECTIPAGNECIIPTLNEAVTGFANKKLYGKVELVVAQTDKDDIIGWQLCDRGNYYLASAFAGEYSKNVKKVVAFENDTIFRYRGRRYAAIKPKKENNLIIREMLGYFREVEIRGLLETQGYDVEGVAIAKVYDLSSQNRYLGAAWIATLPVPGGTTGHITPVFSDDEIKFASAEVNSLNWEFVDVGKIIMQDSEVWQICKNDDGLFLNRSPLKVLRCN
ncbi:MAG: hypothetical protein IJ689_00220 [Alphaproteobacteria bacterium]|nr:hypothetical protein [Alphaproteobacteria bacterium]